MQLTDQETTETPEQRVDTLSPDQLRHAMIGIVRSIIGNKSTRLVPDVLHDHCLLSQFEVYDADAAWTRLEDEIRDLAKWGD